MTIVLTVGFSACGEEAGSEDGETGSSSSGGEDGDTPGWCDPTENWDSGSTAFEAEVLELVNQARAAGANCGSAGNFDPAPPLTMQSNLRCAARMHSLDMLQRDFFDHTNPDGEGPGVRIANSGYEGWSTWGENIAWGQASPASVMESWMNSDGHCGNIMNPDFEHIGIGHTTMNYWTQVFGAQF